MRLPAFATRNLQLKVVAAVLATVTWAGVVYASNPPDTRSLTVHVPQEQGAVAPYVLVHPIGDVVVQVSGTREHLASFEAADIVVTVNYKAIKSVGTQQVPISVINNDRDVMLDNPSPTIQVSVDRLASREVPVTVVVSSPPPQGYVVTSMSTTPSTVSVVGPQQQLAALQARVSVDLSSLRTDFQADGKVLLFDPDGQQLASFGILVNGRPQTTVRVNITIAATITTRASAVVPPHTGQPAPGTEIVGISVTPPTVVLTGPQDLLNSLSFVSTQSISLAGIAGNRTFTVTVEPPPGVTASPTSVTVVVTVVTIVVPTPPPTPTPTPSPTPTPTGPTP